MCNEIEVIVNEREKLLVSDDDDSYQIAIDKVEKFVKYPLIFFIGTVLFLAILPMLYSGLRDLMRGEVRTEDWYLPYRFA